MKKDPDPFGFELQGFQRGTESFFQIDFVFDRLFTHAPMLDFVPNLLIRIELGRMGRKKEQAYLCSMRTHKLAHHRRTVKRGAIGNHDEGPSPSAQQLSQKGHVASSIFAAANE